MSFRVLVPKLRLGPLSNQEAVFRKQNILAIDESGRLRFAPYPRRDPILPPEILAEIFIYCLDIDEDDDDNFIVPDLAAAPLILCGICRRWRDVAISTPALWNSLQIDLGSSNERQTVDFHKMWLSRARTTPLSLKLCLHHRVPGGFEISLLSTINGLSRQWKNIDFEAPDVASFVFPAKGSFPLLEKLRITSVDNLSNAEFLITFCNAPRLREVEVSKYHPHIPIPWHQLTTFRASDIEALDCVDIIRNSSNLVEAFFVVRGQPTTLPVSIVKHSRLEFLALDICYDYDAPDLDSLDVLPVLGCLEIPSLRSLSLEFPERSPDTDVSPFVSFMSRSFAQLRILGLSYMPATTVDLIRCLKVTPTVELLALELALPLIDTVADMDPLFAQLAGPTDFLPKLETLHLVSSLPLLPRMTIPATVRMLCWRWDTVEITQLQTFELVHCHGDQRFDSALALDADLRRLRDEGMDLHIRNSASESSESSSVDSDVDSADEW
ncbi:hypothetical protein C8R47DRAFT_1123300 [Mycena vitilis]|nr:hypothetical protein C8R47DRAFT_1123300 [Mycena vitilis]